MGKITFTYKAVSQDGKKIEGTVEAADSNDALTKLRTMEQLGLRDISIESAQNSDDASALKQDKQRRAQKIQIGLIIGAVISFAILHFIMCRVYKVPSAFDSWGSIFQSESKRTAKTTPAIIQSKKVNCDKFEVVWSLDGNQLNVSVDTDLVPLAEVRLNVSRRYTEKDSTSNYSIDYFSELMPVGDLIKGKMIMLDNNAWELALRAKQKEMAKVGLGFDVADINDYVSVRVSLSRDLFGERNADLTGKAVTQGTVRNSKTVEDEAEIPFSLDQVVIGESPFVNIDFRALEIGTYYKVSKKTPLMKEIDPQNPIGSMFEAQAIMPGGIFRVISRTQRDGISWYEVTVRTEDGIISGWINSLALQSQDLEGSKE